MLQAGAQSVASAADAAQMLTAPVIDTVSHRLRGVGHGRAASKDSASEPSGGRADDGCTGSGPAVAVPTLARTRRGG